MPPSPTSIVSAQIGELALPRSVHGRAIRARGDCRRSSAMPYKIPANGGDDAGGSALQAVAELTAQNGDLGDGETDVQLARGGDVVVQVGHVERVAAQAGLDCV